MVALVPPNPKELDSTQFEALVVQPFAHDRHVFESRIEFVDIGAFADEAVVHHQEAVDRLLRAGCAERMAGQRLGGRDRRAFVSRAEHLSDRLDLLQVADRRRGGVRVDVADLLVDFRDRHPHAAHRAFSGGRHHVVAVGGGAVADDLAIDARAARLGVLELLEHDDARSAGDDESVALRIVGARRLVGLIVEAGRHRPHRVEEHGERPVELLAAACKDHVLLAELDDLVGVADAVVRRRAGRGDRIVHAADLEPGGERRRGGRGHRLRHRERADALRTLGAGHVSRLDDGAGRRAAGAHDHAGAVVGDLVRLETGIADRLFHGDMVPRRAAAMETHGPPVDGALRIELRLPVHLAAEAELLVALRRNDAGARLAQARQHFLRVVADR